MNCQAIKTLEVALLQRHLLLEKCEKSVNEVKDEKTLNQLKSKPIDPKMYSKIGDFNLLLGNYAKGLSDIKTTFLLIYSYVYYMPFRQPFPLIRDTLH